MHQEQPEFSRKQIAEGFSGKVYLTKAKINTGKVQKVAIKKFNPQNQRHFEVESEVFELINPHPLFPQIYSIDKQKHEICMEYCRGGTLLETLQKCGKFEEELAYLYFMQILKGLRHLKRKGLCHRDIKLENLLILRDDRQYLKLIDLSFSSKVLKKAPDSSNTENEKDIYRQFIDKVGTEGYQCPEMVRGGKYSGYEADMFSLGVVLFEMIHGKPPFLVADPNECEFYALFLSDKQLYWELFKSLAPDKSPSLILLLEQLLDEDQNKRISIGSVFKNPWYTEMREKLKQIPKESLRETTLDFDKIIYKISKLQKCMQNENRVEERVKYYFSRILTESQIIRSKDHINEIKQNMDKNLKKENRRISTLEIICLNRCLLQNRGQQQSIPCIHQVLSIFSQLCACICLNKEIKSQLEEQNNFKIDPHYEIESINQIVCVELLWRIDL